MQESPLRVLLVEDNPGDARLVREMLSRAEDYTFEVQCAESLIGALEALARQDFDVVLTDLSLPDAVDLDAFSTIQSHAPRVPIVVVTGLDDESAALQAVRSGAQDYLVKGKLDTPTLVRALRYAVVRKSKVVEQSKGEPERAAIIGFLSSKGGVGTTTIASHFAVEIKQRTQEKLLLANLDVSTGGASFLFKLNASHTILDAARSLHRLDADYWKRVVSKTSDGLDFLASPGSASYGEDLTGERARHVVRFARPFYRWIVLDLGKLDLVSLTLLAELKELFVVTSYELPAMYEAHRVLKKLFELGLTREQVHLVVNRVPRSAGMSGGDLEKALGYPVWAVVFDCSEELNDAYAEGRFLDPGLSLHRDVARLVARSLGTEAEIPRTGLKRLWFARA